MCDKPHYRSQRDIEEAGRFIDIIHKWQNGVHLQYRSRLVPDKDAWIDCGPGMIHWDFRTYLYRVKPTPKEAWVAYVDDIIVGTGHSAAECMRNVLGCNKGPNLMIVKLRQVDQ